MVTTRSGLVSDKGKQVSKQHKTGKKSPKKSDVQDKPGKKPPVSQKNQKTSKNHTKKPLSKPTSKAKSQPQPPKPKAKSPSPPPPSPPSPPSSSNNSIYTFDQFQNYKKFKDELNDKKLPELKEMCKSNDMKVSGTKTELIERIADAKVLGVIPKCPSCGGGRPRLNPKSRTYFCNGYLDDTIFKNCHKTFAYSEIVREPWKDS